MDFEKASELLRKLANGVNPQTAEPLPQESPYNTPEIVRALFVACEHLPKRKKSSEQKQQENLQKGLPRNSGLPWLDEARTAVANLYRAGASIEKIASSQDRSRLAIVAELKRQNVITAEEAAKYGLNATRI